VLNALKIIKASFINRGAGTLLRLSAAGKMWGRIYFNNNMAAATQWRRTPLRLQNTKAGKDHVEDAAKSAAGSFFVRK
jgi:hypothetical protein